MPAIVTVVSGGTALVITAGASARSAGPLADGGGWGWGWVAGVDAVVVGDGGAPVGACPRVPDRSGPQAQKVRAAVSTAIGRFMMVLPVVAGVGHHRRRRGSPWRHRQATDGQ